MFLLQINTHFQLCQIILSKTRKSLYDMLLLCDPMQHLISLLTSLEMSSQPRHLYIKKNPVMKGDGQITKISKCSMFLCSKRKKRAEG